LRQGRLGDESGGAKAGQEQCPLHVSSPLKNSVIPTGAEPLDFARDRLREAQWRDLFLWLDAKNRSLDYAARWAASLGMTEYGAGRDKPGQRNPRNREPDGQPYPTSFADASSTLATAAT
jgi:hypothetical protein